MIGTSTAIAFLATQDAERARVFYSETLGLRLLSEDQFALVFDLSGIPLRIQKVEALNPHPFTSLGWQVRGVRRIITGLVKRGVVFERYPFLEQDADGIWLAPSGTRVAWFKDLDGNLLSLSDSTAE